MLAVPQEMRLIFTIANNICTLLMLVYKYGIAMFYIYLYMSISIYTAILWKETRKKTRYSQEIGLIGELQSRAQKKGAMTTLALDDHTRDGSLSTQGGLCIRREAPCLKPATTTFHLLVQNNSVCVGPRLAMELLIVTLFRDQILGCLCAVVSPGLCT